MTTVNSAIQHHPLICQYTGMKVGQLSVITVAGRVPFLSQWKQSQALHPIFSLEPTPLLKFATNLWNNFCALSPEEAANVSVTEKKEKLLQVTALAMLHHLTEVEQTTRWLPNLSTVSSCWSELMQLSYWKNYLDSKRFTFPTLRISKFQQPDLHSYLQTCWAVKKDYETQVRQTAEESRANAADAALAILRSDLTKKTPKSKKLLWRWFSLNLPARYSKDLEGWMWELFDAETLDEISEFTIADIDLFEEITLSEIPTGSAVSHAFLERISYKRSILENKFSTFEIMIPEIISQQKEAGNISATEPSRADFLNKIDFIIAHAKWKLAHTDMSKHLRAAEKEQATVSVSLSTHIPKLPDALTEESPESLDELPLSERIKKPVDMWDEENRAPW